MFHFMTCSITGKSKMLGKSLLLPLVGCSLILMTRGEMPLMEVKEKCREEHNLTMEQIQHLNTTKRLDTNDEKIKCFVKCMLIELKVMNEEGVFTSDDAIISMLKDKKYYPICSEVTGADLCDKAVNFQNCFWKQIKMEEAESE